MFTFRTLIFIFAISAGNTSAQPWQATKGSRLDFSSNFQSEVFSGSFARFSPQIYFDPKNLAQSRFDVWVDLSSINTKNQERDEMLKTIDFFDTKKFSKAHFSANQFQSLGQNRYIAKGQLNLHGLNKPVNLYFTWQAGAQPVLIGKATVNRLDFNIGTGDWADTAAIPNAVAVTTTLILSPSPPTKP